MTDGGTDQRHRGQRNPDVRSPDVQGPDTRSLPMRAADAVEQASDTRVLDVAARFGFGALAVVHILIGIIALRIAFGGDGEAEPTGALEAVAGGWLGTPTLALCAVGCAGLALWQLSEATLRARHLPTRERLGKHISSGALVIIYGSMAGTFVRFTLGEDPDSSESTVDFTRYLLGTGLGVLLVLVTAGVILGIGVHFVIKGVRRNFRPELRKFENTAHGHVIEVLGVIGHVSKGIALLLVGGLFVIAGLDRDAGESTGLDGSLKALQLHPMGVHVLTAIAVGLICYGIFAVIRAVFGRM